MTNRGIYPLKPKAADGEQVSMRDIHSSLMRDRLGKEWMCMIVVDYFPVLDDPEGGAYLGLGPSSGLSDTDRDGIRITVSREGISLRGGDAELLVLGITGGILMRLVFCHGAQDVLTRTAADHLRSSPGKERK